ncbi:uncharacterized protein LOC102810422 [Saccoglossus kowalevskii]|uniref:Uncharacterized protein LOC102810422 n=1 Tax=Saccoglossus kowalevskii TaxID=10224 RepID=A0ABM0MCV0_SACKO|nr:PREDICTED: uncharacterized protein LOC102810422 [Saccoglossus kowalevskii]
MLPNFVIIAVSVILFAPYTSTSSEHYEVTWWAKHVVPDYYTAGRLSGRQMMHAADAGFNSIFGNYNHTEEEKFGDEELPTTYVCKQIADRLGMEFDIFPPEIWWSTREGVEYFVQKMDAMKQPTLVYCDTAYSATAIVLLGLMYKTQKDPSFKPKIYSDEFYRIGQAHGFDFDADECLNELVSSITGEPEVKLRTDPSNKLIFWRDYWYAKYISSDWFSAGKIRDKHVSAIVSGGYKAIVNVRNKRANLLNAADMYRESHNKDSDGRMSEIHMDPSQPDEYTCISLTSENQQQCDNPDGCTANLDHSGQIEMGVYNGGRGKVIPYYHIQTDDVTGELFYQYVDKLEEASSHGSVIVHCDSGRRGTAWALLAEGYFNCKNSTWALQQASYMGYRFTEDDDEYRAFIGVLDSANPNCGHQCSLP